MPQTRPSPTLSRGFTRLGRFLAPYDLVGRPPKSLRHNDAQHGPTTYFTPRHLLRRRLLAELFQTSITATAIRLVERGEFPALLVCTDRFGARVWFAARMCQIAFGHWTVQELTPLPTNCAQEALLTRQRWPTRTSGWPERHAIPIVFKKTRSRALLDRS